MKTSKLGRAASLLTAVVLFTGPSALAADPPLIHTADIALASGGLLSGAVLASDSQPLADTRVVILHGTNTVAEATTDSQGEFAVKGLRNGAHTVRVGSRTQPVRFWTSSAAPPNAAPKLVLVGQDNVVRGQDGGSNLAPWLLIGGATAIVLATTLDDGNEPVVSSP